MKGFKELYTYDDHTKKRIISETAEKVLKKNLTVFCEVLFEGLFQQSPLRFFLSLSDTEKILSEIQRIKRLIKFEIVILQD